MISRERQKERLANLLKKASRSDDSCNYGAMLYIEGPGDVCFLAPMFPEFRGIEIVSASPERSDGRNYDIWHHPEKLIKSNMTAKEVIAWLRENSKPDPTVIANLAEWAEDVLRFYRIPKKHNARHSGS